MRIEFEPRSDGMQHARYTMCGAGSTTLTMDEDVLREATLARIAERTPAR
jgi:hypothetical protein